MDLVCQAVNLDHTSVGGIGDRVVIPRNAHHPVMADPPLKLQNRPERDQRQAAQCRTFFGEGFVDDPSGRCVDTHIGDITKPAGQLRVQVVNIAEYASQKEVLTDITERSFDLAFGLWPIRPTSLGQKAIMARQVAKPPL